MNYKCNAWQGRNTFSLVRLKLEMSFWQKKTCFEQFLFWWWLCEWTSFLLKDLADVPLCEDHVGSGNNKIMGGWWVAACRASEISSTAIWATWVHVLRGPTSCTAAVSILSWILPVALEITVTWLVRSEFLHISETSVHAHEVARHPGFKTGARWCGWPLGNETVFLVYQGCQLTEVCWQIKGIRQTDVCERASLI